MQAFDTTSDIMESHSQCTVGMFCSDNCQGAIIDTNKLTKEEQQFLFWRTGIAMSVDLPEGTCCDLHKDKYLRRFSLNIRRCINIFKIHKNTITSGLREISLDTARKL